MTDVSRLQGVRRSGRNGLKLDGMVKCRPRERGREVRSGDQREVTGLITTNTCTQGGKIE